MNFKDHPVNHDHKHSPQSEQAGENDGFLQSLRSSIQHFKKEGKGEFAAGILLAVNRYKEYAALWQAASQEKGVGAEDGEAEKSRQAIIENCGLRKEVERLKIEKGKLIEALEKFIENLYK